MSFISREPVSLIFSFVSPLISGRAPLKLVTAFCVSLVLGCGTISFPTSTLTPAAPEVKLTIFHTNDHHGHFWPNKHGEFGMPARKTLLDQLRQQVSAEGGYSLLLSGGDINTGVPESDMLNAEPDFKGMALLGYDAMALGNHEFDNSLDIIRQQQRWAGFPFLSANIYHRVSGERLFQPYKIFTLGNDGGLKVAVLGLTTEDTAIIGNPEYLTDIVFTNAIDEAKKLVPMLRSKADIVIVLTHMGHYDNGNHMINAPGDVSLARAVEGIDLIVGGHTQDPLCMAAENVRNVAYIPGDPCVPDIQTGTVIVQAHEWGKYVGKADFVFKKGGMLQGSELTLAQYQLIPVNLTRHRAAVAGELGTGTSVTGEPRREFIRAEIPPAADMLALLKPYQAQGSEALYQKVASVNGRLEGERSIVRSRATNLGTLIATAQMRALQADLAVMNAGGIRASLEPGDITVKDLLSVQPFGNTLCYVELTGLELKKYLQTLLKMPAGGGFPQFAGLRRGQDDWWVTGLRERKIVDEEKYRLAINSFIATGGNGYAKLSDHSGFVNSGLTDVGELQRFLQKLGSVDVTDFAP